MEHGTIKQSYHKMLQVIFLLQNHHWRDGESEKLLLVSQKKPIVSCDGGENDEIFTHRCVIIIKLSFKA